MTVTAPLLLSQKQPPAAHRKHSCWAKITTERSIAHLPEKGPENLKTKEKNTKQRDTVENPQRPVHVPKPTLSPRCPHMVGGWAEFHGFSAALRPHRRWDQGLPSATCRSDLIHKRGLRRCDSPKHLEVRSSSISRVGPMGNDRRPDKSEAGRRTRRHRGKGQVRTGAEMGVTQSHAKGHQGVATAVTGNEQSHPWLPLARSSPQLLFSPCPE